MKTFKFLLVLCTRENTDVLLHSMKIFMVVTLKEQIVIDMFLLFLP